MDITCFDPIGIAIKSNPFAGFTISRKTFKGMIEQITTALDGLVFMLTIIIFIVSDIVLNPFFHQTNERGCGNEIIEMLKGLYQCLPDPSLLKSKHRERIPSHVKGEFKLQGMQTDGSLSIYPLDHRSGVRLLFELKNTKKFQEKFTDEAFHRFAASVRDPNITPKPLMMIHVWVESLTTSREKKARIDILSMGGDDLLMATIVSEVKKIIGNCFDLHNMRTIHLGSLSALNNMRMIRKKYFLRVFDKKYFQTYVTTYMDGWTPEYGYDSLDKLSQSESQNPDNAIGDVQYESNIASKQKLDEEIDDNEGLGRKRRIQGERGRQHSIQEERGPKRNIREGRGCERQCKDPNLECERGEGSKSSLKKRPALPLSSYTWVGQIEEGEDPIYEVVEIIRGRGIKTHQQDTRELLVMWKGYQSPSWHALNVGDLCDTLKFDCWVKGILQKYVRGDTTQLAKTFKNAWDGFVNDDEELFEFVFDFFVMEKIFNEMMNEEIIDAIERECKGTSENIAKGVERPVDQECGYTSPNSDSSSYHVNHRECECESPLIGVSNSGYICRNCRSSSHEEQDMETSPINGDRVNVSTERENISSITGDEKRGVVFDKKPLRGRVLVPDSRECSPSKANLPPSSHRWQSYEGKRESNDHEFVPSSIPDEDEEDDYQGKWRVKK